jgi:hypothetical protein
MRRTFVSESITPLEASFDTRMMARGEPGLPHKFRWRDQEWNVAEVLDTWKEHGDCSHGSGERYVRKHGYRVRTTNGWLLRIYFQRTFGRGKFQRKDRWWIQSIESKPDDFPPLRLLEPPPFLRKIE